MNSFNTIFSDFFILSSPVVSQFQLLHTKYSTHVSTMHTMACDGHRECVNVHAMVKCQAQALRLLELPSGLGLYSLALVLFIILSVVMRITGFSSFLMFVSLHLAARVPRQLNSSTGYPRVPYACQPSLVQRPRAARMQQGLPVRLGHMVDHYLDVVLGLAPPEESVSVEVLDATLRALGLRLPEQSCVVEEIRPDHCRSKGADSSDMAWWDTSSEAESEGMSSEAVTDDESASGSRHLHNPPCAPDHFMGGWGYSRSEQEQLALAPPVSSADPCGLVSIESAMLRSDPPTSLGGQTQVQFQVSRISRLQSRVRRSRRWNTFAATAQRGELCLKPQVIDSLHR